LGLAIYRPDLVKGVFVQKLAANSQIAMNTAMQRTTILKPYRILAKFIFNLLPCEDEASCSSAFETGEPPTLLGLLSAKHDIH
jgi:hypothetical protein